MRDRLLGTKGSGCKNRIITEEELLRQMEVQLELSWQGTEHFDAAVFCNSAADVEITNDGVRVKRKRIV